jgi:DDE superfamily endonuclease
VPPADPEDQQAYDSGKQKCHTLKNLRVIEETCQMSFLSATYEGKAHEKILAELEGYTLPPGSCLSQDMGFQGYTCEGITIVQPKKKPPRGELTPPEKAANRAISSIRIRIEHAIGGVKRYRIVKDKIRLLKDGVLVPKTWTDVIAVLVGSLHCRVLVAMLPQTRLG